MHNPNPNFALFIAHERAKFVDFKDEVFIFEVFKVFAPDVGRNAFWATLKRTQEATAGKPPLRGKFREAKSVL